MRSRTKSPTVLGVTCCLLLACEPRQETPVSAVPAVPGGGSSAVAGPPQGAAPATASPRTPQEALASLDDLLAHIDEADAHGLSKALERLLLAGSEGEAEILELAVRCDGDSARARVLTTHGAVGFGIARVVHLHPAESLAIALRMLESVPPAASSPVWGQILGYLPVFLAYHDGRFAEERIALESLLLERLPTVTGRTRFLLFDAALRLGIEPAASVLIPLLDTDPDFATHRAIIYHLVERGRDGIQAVVDWLDRTTDFSAQAPRATLELLGGSDDVAARQCIQRYLSHSNLTAREAAVRAYFRRPRGVDALPIALDFLNSRVSLQRKRFFISLLRRNAAEVLETLRSTPEAVFAPDVRALLDSTPKARANRTSSTSTPERLPAKPESP